MSTPKNNLLTRVQAICLVLDMVSTVDNRRKGNDIDTTYQPNFISKQLPQLPKFMDASKFGKLIKDKDFGERVSKRVERKNIKERMLYKLKDNAIRNLVESTSAFRTEINNDGSNWINVGYVRKSPGIESVATQQELLKAMIMKLRNRCLSLYLRLYQLNIIFTDLGKRFLGGQHQHQQQQHQENQLGLLRWGHSSNDQLHWPLNQKDSALCDFIRWFIKQSWRRCHIFKV
ncbi:hypothetical protein BDF14DRAFT_1879605 [Spinellus fusiger]|nr:hypothetical protein BDF14DRAFT_1879605 [Spinellus fusiger]